MKTSPLVDVNIVTYNSENTIRLCLRSVFQQTYAHIRVRVIDNKSTDNTTETLRGFPVDVIHNSTNLGYAKAHNQAFGKSHGKYVLTLNPDVVLDRTFISNIVMAMENNPMVGSGCGLLLRVEDLKKHSDTVDATGLYLRRNRRQGLRNEHRKKEDAPKTNEYIFGPDGAAAFYRRSMLTDIAYHHEVFDEDFYMYKEDVDVCWRAQLFGWKSLFVPSSVAYHRRSFRPGERLYTPQNLRIFSVRNRYFLMIKNDLTPIFLRDIFRILLYEIQILGYILLREQSSLPAYLQAIRQIPFMLKKRKDTQGRKRVDSHYMRQWFTS
jgi:GT2 family glycosyltransferase